MICVLLLYFALQLSHKILDGVSENGVHAEPANINQELEPEKLSVLEKHKCQEMKTF